jgi:tight adherence protein C
VIAESLAFGAGLAGAASLCELVPRRRARRGASARRRSTLTAHDLLRAKAAAGMAAAVVGLAAGAMLPGRLGIVAAVAAPLAGFFGPEVWLARRRTDRLMAVRRDLPALLDLLGASVAAGLSLPEALAEVARRSRAPLARLWGGIAAQVAVGVPLAAALEAHRREVPIAEVESFTAALERAARHGAPLAETLAAQARTARLARRRAVQEDAARAGPKMQLVVALLLVPSVMLVVAAALLSALAGGGAAMLSGP